MPGGLGILHGRAILTNVKLCGPISPFRGGRSIVGWQQQGITYDGMWGCPAGPPPKYRATGICLGSW